MSAELFGYRVYSGDLKSCVDEMAAEALSGQRNCRIMACLNPHSFVVAQDDMEFRAALKSADWLVPDGVGVVIAARWLRLPIKARVSGPDIFSNLMERLNQCQGSVFLLGSSEGTLERIRERIALEYPHVLVAGTYSPPFAAEQSPQENLKIVSAVNAARPDVLWVAMTAPKQEKWLAKHRPELDVGVAGAVGAAFDFFAGTVKRSPAIFRSTGLEWLPRFLRQPRRLWRRMFISAPAFLFEIYRHRRRNSGKRQNLIDE